MKFWKQKRREKLRAQPLPEEWIRLLVENVPLYNRLPRPDRDELHGHIQVFLDEKQFEGCAGVVIDDVIRLVIASQACVPLLHRDTDYYPDLSSILVYPSTYVAPVVEHEGGMVSEYDEERAGETWQEGSLVLSWDDVRGTVEARPASASQSDTRRGGGNGGGNGHSHEDAIAALAAGDEEPVPGAELVPAYNVVLHEFAHQLDMENGALDGVPRLASNNDYDRWSTVFEAAFQRLYDELEAGTDPVIDPYGAHDEAEFFACVTESFFDTPIALFEEYPEVYEEMARYFRQDPAAWGEVV